MLHCDIQVLAIFEKKSNQRRVPTAFSMNPSVHYQESEEPYFGSFVAISLQVPRPCKRPAAGRPSVMGRGSRTVLVGREISNGPINHVNVMLLLSEQIAHHHEQVVLSAKTGIGREPLRAMSDHMLLIESTC